MNYKEHIETLEGLLDTPAGENREETVRFCIAHLSAAEPKDEAAERRYCRNVSKQLMARSPDEREEMLMRERAAVRAPLQAEIERLTRERDVMAFERDTHMEANQERAATFHTNGVQSLNKQLSEALRALQDAQTKLREANK